MNKMTKSGFQNFVNKITKKFVLKNNINAGEIDINSGSNETYTIDCGFAPLLFELYSGDTIHYLKCKDKTVRATAIYDYSVSDSGVITFKSHTALGSNIIWLAIG